jgi:hypothetical protein
VKQGEYLLLAPIHVVHRAGEGSISPVGRYLSFLRGDRPSRLAMQRKKLLPMREAHMLNENFANREQRLLEMLAVPPAPATTAVPVAAPTGSATKPAKAAVPKPAKQQADQTQ